MAQSAVNDAAVGAKSGPVQMQQQQPTPEVTQAMDSARQRDERSRDSSRDRESR